MTAVWIPPVDRSKFMANMMASSLGAAVTMPLCGYLIEYIDWQSVFYVTGKKKKKNFYIKWNIIFTLLSSLIIRVHLFIILRFFEPPFNCLIHIYLYFLSIDPYQFAAKEMDMRTIYTYLYISMRLIEKKTLLFLV